MAKIHGLVLILAAAACGTAQATDTGKRPAPPPDVVDCSDARTAEMCFECGGNEIGCCFDPDDCEIKNEPPKRPAAFGRGRGVQSGAGVGGSQALPGSRRVGNKAVLEPGYRFERHPQGGYTVVPVGSRAMLRNESGSYDCRCTSAQKGCSALCGCSEVIEGNGIECFPQEHCNTCFLDITVNRLGRPAPTASRSQTPGMPTPGRRTVTERATRTRTLGAGAARYQGLEAKVVPSTQTPQASPPNPIASAVRRNTARTTATMQMGSASTVPGARVVGDEVQLDPGYRFEPDGQGGLRVVPMKGSGGGSTGAFHCYCKKCPGSGTCGECELSRKSSTRGQCVVKSGRCNRCSLKAQPDSKLQLPQ